MNLCFSFGSDGQVAKTVPLDYNPTLINTNQPGEQIDPSLMLRERDTLELPFFDDFSYRQVTVKDSFWVEDYVFVNNRMAINPPSYGVATFDGLNEFGKPYNPDRNNQNSALPTDTLTSQFIDLSPYSASDNVFLSFHYQPKGKGDGPERIDSLKLEFKAVSDTNTWQTIWAAGGQGSYLKVPPFETVNINIGGQDSNVFFHNTFQFRFVSHGNVSGNLDHWHLDYVWLDKNRTSGIPIRRDVAMVEPAESILQKYRALPWRQIKNNENLLRKNFFLKGSNNSNGLSGVKCGYKIKDLYTGETFETFTKDFTQNIESFFGKRVYKQENLFNLIPFVAEDSLRLRITSAVVEPSDEVEQNDTFRLNQNLNDYVAYDDGTAEAGFGLKGIFYDNWKVAYQFNLNKADTLRAVGMKFNRSIKGIDNKRFNLMVWNKLGPLGENPSAEELLLEKEDQKVKYNGNGHDNFVIYELENPIEVSGTFFIGWKQLSPFMLNIGLDKNYGDLFRNKEPNNRIFVNQDGSWNKTILDSASNFALMIRPYISNQPISDFSNTKKAIKNNPLEDVSLSLYPNPAKDFVKIKMNRKPEDILKGKVLNANGQVLKRFHLSKKNKRLNLNGFSEGLYMVNIELENGETLTKKLLLQ